MVTSLLHLDAVQDSTSHRSAIVALRWQAVPSPPAAPDWPPPGRFANNRLLREVLERLVQLGTARPVAWALVLDGEGTPEVLNERFLDLFEWGLLEASCHAVPVAQTVVSDRVGLRGAGDATGRLLPNRDDLEAVGRRVRSELGATGCNPPLLGDTVVTPLGVPKTPPGLVAARFVGLAILDLGAGPTRASWPWVHAAPTGADMASLRRIPALARERPPRPLALAELVTHFEREGRKPGREVIGEVGAWLGDHALELFRSEASDRPEDTQTAETLRATLGQIAGMADGGAGDYEACEKVLRLYWDEDPRGETSILERALGRDHWTLARARIARARIASHRGDPQHAHRSVALARRSAAHESSLRSRLLSLEAALLEAVAAQNQWPFEPGSLSDARAMEDASTGLEGVIRELRSTLGSEVDEPPPDFQPLDLGSLGRELWRNVRDPLFGKALGSLGRSWGFLGRHDQAARALLDARSLFVASKDRTRCVHHLAHLELDRGPRFNDGLLQRMLDQILPAAARAPEVNLHRLSGGDKAFRFTINLLLKTLLRSRAVPGLDRRTWATAFSAEGTGSWFDEVRSLRSRPTDLLARHAAELLRVSGEEEAAGRWFALGVEVGREGGITMQRMAAFTERLWRGGGEDAAAPRGSILNPCYEYR